MEVTNTTRIGQVKESGERLLKVEVRNIQYFPKNRYCLRLNYSSKQKMKSIVRSTLLQTFHTKRDCTRRRSDQNYINIEVLENQICLFVKIR